MAEAEAVEEVAESAGEDHSDRSERDRMFELYFFSNGVEAKYDNENNERNEYYLRNGNAEGDAGVFGADDLEEVSNDANRKIIGVCNPDFCKLIKSQRANEDNCKGEMVFFEIFHRDCFGISLKAFASHCTIPVTWMFNTRSIISFSFAREYCLSLVSL